MFHWILDTGYLVTYYHIPGPGHWAGRVMGLVSGPGKLETGESEQCSVSTPRREESGGSWAELGAILVC